VEGTQRLHYGKNKAQFCDARDGKRYVYVQMGSKTWMAENLNYKADDSDCYGDEESNCDTYGRLYDWETAKTACPSGWHLPNTDDWNDLMKFVNPICTDYNETYVCSDAGTKLKAASGWYVVSGVPKGTDDYGFAALPGGGLAYDYDDDAYYYGNLGDRGWWWNVNDYDPKKADIAAIYSNDEDVKFQYLNKSSLVSVRCVKGEPPPPNSSSSYKVVSSSSEEELNDCSAEDNDDYEYCSNGATMEEYGFVTDKDGQDYKTVKIGKQTWMAENLNYKVSGSLCFDNEDDNCELYGRLYNWEAAMSACPSGWHLPDTTEWKTLVTYVGANPGTKLKSINGWDDYYGEDDEDDYNDNPANGTDRYGFAALPGGQYIIQTTTHTPDRCPSYTPGVGCQNTTTTTTELFSNAGSNGYWWSSSKDDWTGVVTGNFAYYRSMSSNNENVGSSLASRNVNDKNGVFFSVRCLKN